MGTNLGRMWDHESSSTLEFSWNVLRANGATEASFSKRGLPTCPDFILTLPLVNPRIRQSESLSAAFYSRIVEGAPFPAALTDLSRLFISGLPPDYKGCRHCAENGVHASVFDIPWIRRCPAHGTILQLVSGFRFKDLARQRTGRRGLTDKLDGWSKGVLRTLSLAAGHVHPFVPMSRRETGLRQWHFDLLYSMYASHQDQLSCSQVKVNDVSVYKFPIRTDQRFSVSEARGLLDLAYKRETTRANQRVETALEALDKGNSEGRFDPSKLALESGFKSFLSRDEQYMESWKVAQECEIDWPNWRSPRVQALLATELDFRVGAGLTADQLSSECIENIVRLKIQQTLLHHLLKHQPRLQINVHGSSSHSNFSAECDAGRFTALHLTSPRELLLVPIVRYGDVIGQAVNPTKFWCDNEWAWPW